MRLRDILREQLGGTYSVGVSYSNTSPQPGYGVTSVQFGSAPENVESLTAAVMTEIDRLRREGPSAEDVQRRQGSREERPADGRAAERLLAQLAAGDAPARDATRSASCGAPSGPTR